MAIPRFVWRRSVLVIACVLVSPAAFASSGSIDDRDLVRLIQVLETGDDLACEKALAELVQLGPSAGDAVDSICRHLGSRNLLVRSRASDALVAIGPASVEPLKQHLEDSSAVARASALQSLGRLKAITVDRLTQLVDDPDARVRASVAIAIRHGEYEKETSLLIELLRDDEPAVLIQACNVLKNRQASSEKVVPALIAALSKTSTLSVVMETLSSYGTEAQSAIPELIARASEIRNQIQNYRSSFETMLAKIGPPSQSDSKVLGRWLGTSDPAKTEIIAITLARMSVVDASISDRLEQLTHELLDQGLLIERRYAKANWETQEEFDDSYSYFSAAESCAVAYWNLTHDSVRFIDLVERLARETESLVYFDEDMGPINPWRTFSKSDAVAIAKILKSKNQNVINTAFSAVNSLGPKSAVHSDLLIELLATSEPHPDWWKTPAGVLRNIGPSVAEKALPAMVQSFKQGKISLENLAGYVDEVQILTEPCEAILKDGLNSSDRFTAKECARALCRTSQDPEQTVGLLLNAVKSGHLSKADAFDAILRLSSIPDLAQETLMKALSQDDEWIQGKAAVALGKMGPRAKKSVSEIKSLLKSKHFETRLQASTALFRITGDQHAFDRFVKTELADESNGIYERMKTVEAITGLGNRGQKFHHHIWENLFQLLEHDPTRLCKALQLSNCGGSIKLLEHIARSKNWVAQTEANAILNSIKNAQQSEPQR